MTRYSLAVLIMAVSFLGRQTGGENCVSYACRASNFARINLPLVFIENKGQVNRDVKYIVHSRKGTAFFTNDGVVLAFNKPWSVPALRLQFVNRNPRGSSILGVGREKGIFNYFVGERSRWVKHARGYSKLVYKEVWPGIDIVYYSSGGILKYNLHVRPGADPSVARIRYLGVGNVETAKSGDLIVSIGTEKLREKKPIIYQRKGERRVYVPGHFVVSGNEVGIEVGKYDHSIPLIIDPQTDLVWSSFLGGLDDDVACATAIGPDGCIFISGYTRSPDFPTPGGMDTSLSNTDAFVAKVSADGKTLLWATFLGGSNHDGAFDVAVDLSGCAYVVGYTASSDFPTPVGFDKTYNGYTDGFVLKLSSNGSFIVYSTFLGGTDDVPDEVRAIAVDSAGSAYVTGKTGSADFPVTPGAYDTTYNDDGNGYTDGFVTKLNLSGTSLQYSTFIGGSTGFEEPRGIAVDSTGCAYVCGTTSANNFPAVAAYDATFNGGTDVFVSKLSSTGSGLVYSTYVGGAGSDNAYALAVDAAGCAYVAGATLGFMSPYYPTTVGAYDTSANGDFDAFVTKLSASGSSLVYSTFLGGSYSEWAYGIAVDQKGCAYVVGGTLSSNFPVTPDAYDQTKGDAMDVFVTKLNSLGSCLHYSTFVGNADSDLANDIALDNVGWAYIVGYTSSTGFPVTSSSFMTTYGGGTHDAFVARLAVPESMPVSTIKWMPNNARVETHGAVVTGAYVDPAGADYFYIESVDRTAGIRVQKEAHGLTPGIRVDVIGTVRTNTYGERYIDVPTISTVGVGQVEPLGMNLCSVGGQRFCNPVTGIGQEGVAGGIGLNNIGLLVRIWGVLTQIGSGYFYLDDGSGLRDGTLTGSIENVGIRVVGVLPLGCGQGDFVEVTGISSCFRETPPSSPILRRVLALESSGVRKINE